MWQGREERPGPWRKGDPRENWRKKMEEGRMEIRVQGKGAGQKFGGRGKAGCRTKRWDKEMLAQMQGMGGRRERGGEGWTQSPKGLGGSNQNKARLQFRIASRAAGSAAAPPMRSGDRELIDAPLPGRAGAPPLPPA